jgi:hypothetical protein
VTDENKLAVVDVLDTTHVVINAGTTAGIKYGDRFVVFTNDREVYDIDGRSLGLLELVKGYGSVTHAQEALSILKADTFSGFKAETDPMAGIVSLPGKDQSYLKVLRGDTVRKV